MTTSDEHATRERLLHEAERLFMAHGFAAVSTREICAAAGVKQPSLYHFFGNKEALFLAVIARWFARFGAGIARALAEQATLRHQLHAIAVLFWAGPAGEYQAMQRDAMHHLAPDHLQQIGTLIWQTLLSPLAERFRAASAAGTLPDYADPLVLTQIFWGVVDGIGGIYHRGDPMPPPEHNIAIIDFFLAGARGMSRDDFALWPRQRHHALFRQSSEEQA